MKKRIVHDAAEILLVGGGALDKGALLRALEIDRPVVAADGGADAVLAAGRMPDAVIGDMDSLSDVARRRIPADRLHHVPQQNDTDFDKCLDRLDAPLIVGMGFLGARLDHQLAAMSTLVRHAHRPCLLHGGGDLVLALPPELRLDLQAGTRVSLFPMASVSGRSSGLRWPIDGLEFAPSARIGTSNVANGGPVHLSLDGPGMLIILPEAAWTPLKSALDDRPGWWPAP